MKGYRAIAGRANGIRGWTDGDCGGCSAGGPSL